MKNLKTCPECNGQGFVAKWDNDKALPILHKCECVRCGGSGSVEMSREESVKRLADAFGVDVVIPVRCRECGHYEPCENPVEDFDGRCDIRQCETDEEEYCSYGERRSVVTLTMGDEMTPFTEEQWDYLRKRYETEEEDGR